MSNSETNKNLTTPSTAELESNGPEQMVDVLYQKMGNRVYAFSLIDDEVFFGSLTEDEISAAAPARDESIVDAATSNLRRGNA